MYPAKNPAYPFSEAVSYGGVLYLSGELGTNVNGELVEGGIEAEAKQAMENIETKLKRRELTMSDIVKCTVFLADISEWPAFNEIYKPFFNQGEYPARSALAAAGLALNARVEIECIAAEN